jgi:dienelactone hydrolase
MNTNWKLSAILILVLTLNFAAAQEPRDPKKAAEPTPLAGTKLLDMKGDIASELVSAVDKFLLKEIDKSVERRAAHWKRDFSSPEAYDKSIEPNRKRLAHMLGLRDPRVPFDAPELIATTSQPALVGKGKGYEIFAIRWPAFGDVHGEGLLLVPTGKKIADVVAIPDADQTPEQLVGLSEGIEPKSQFARRLAESGCRVVVPVLIDRKLEKRNGRANLTSREFLYRSAFELGRHLIGYELQKVLAVVDWFAKEGDKETKIGVIGYGEGGMLALYAGALDTRIHAVGVSGYFGNRNGVWQQPIDRNVFGLLEQFGDAELAAMVKPRALVLEGEGAPYVELPSQGGAPARLVRPTEEEFKKERNRIRDLINPSGSASHFDTSIPTLVADGVDYASEFLLKHFLRGLTSSRLEPEGKVPQHARKHFDPEDRQKRQVRELDRHNQHLLQDCENTRRTFFKDLDTKSLDAYKKTVEPYRKHFAEEVIGRFDYPLEPFNARSRKAYDEEKWTGYEVVLDVFPGVFAYGILLVPKDIKDGEKRPVVVCQHGLEGRPQHVIGKEGYQYYKAFAAELANRGFVTFAPQNLYIGQEKFRTLQRKANPLKKTLFSIIVPQHQQIVNWLKSQPFVDGERIAFYGLSYGGKSAMRIPPLVTDYALSICSADFNEWVKKNASSKAPYSYVWTGEYEIFEFDLGSTFNYAEMAALICPRPFMVERGHFDGVGVDEEVAYEFAKVRHLYQARLGIGDRTEIEWFVGPHTINGKATYAFLHKHLKWPEKRQ